MNDPDFNLLAALDPLPVSTEVITVSQAWHPRLEQAPTTAGWPPCGSGDTLCLPCVFYMADVPKIFFTFWRFGSILVAAFSLFSHL